MIDLAAEWDLPGGAEAFVADVTTADGLEAVLKVSPPDCDPPGSEPRMLLATRGRGYVAVYRHDQDREAMLLEGLGP